MVELNMGYMPIYSIIEIYLLLDALFKIGKYGEKSERRKCLTFVKGISLFFITFFFLLTDFLREILAFYQLLILISESEFCRTARLCMVMQIYRPFSCILV